MSKETNTIRNFYHYTTFANRELKEIREVKAKCFMAKYSTPNGWKQNASSPRLSTLIQKNLSPPLPTKAAGAAGFNVAFYLNL